MNVDLPGQNDPNMFWIVVGISVAASASLSVYFMKKR
jgi:Mg2+ and Co2+ transporter CorA